MSGNPPHFFLTLVIRFLAQLLREVADSHRIRVRVNWNPDVVGKFQHLLPSRGLPQSCIFERTVPYAYGAYFGTISRRIEIRSSFGVPSANAHVNAAIWPKSWRILLLLPTPCCPAQFGNDALLIHPFC